MLRRGRAVRCEYSSIIPCLMYRVRCYRGCGSDCLELRNFCCTVFTCIRARVFTMSVYTTPLRGMVCACRCACSVSSIVICDAVQPCALCMLLDREWSTLPCSLRIARMLDCERILIRLFFLASYIIFPTFCFILSPLQENTSSYIHCTNQVFRSCGGCLRRGSLEIIDGFLIVYVPYITQQLQMVGQ